MEPKRDFYTEWAYFLGLIILAFGTALMEKANFGMSMVVAPAYLLHLKLQQYWPAFTFGMAEYVFQAVLLIILSVVLKRRKISYLFSFITAVIYGFTLDFAMRIVGMLVGDGLLSRLVLYSAGIILCAVGVALLFHTYIAPEAYELFVKEISAKYGYPIAKVKTVYDCCSCLIGIVLSFVFFGLGHFEGVKLGTVICAIVNGWLIGQINNGLESLFSFKDAFPMRSLFDQ